MAYLTPDTPPTEYVSITLEIPDDTFWLALFFGALTELENTSNFEEFGDLTPEETALIWQDIIEAAVRS